MGPVSFLASLRRRLLFGMWPCREFAPAGDLLFAPPKSRQKALPCKTAPVGSPAMLEAQGRTQLTSLRCVQTKGLRSQLLMRAARAPRASALLGGLEGEAPETAQQPTAKPEDRLAPAVHHSPFEPAEERRTLRPCAQRTSRTDSAQLFDRSVAKGVLRGASRSEHRRAARCAAKGRAVRGRLFAFFWSLKKKVASRGELPAWACAPSRTSISSRPVVQQLFTLD